MLFICYPKCTTCQKAQKWLDAQGVSVKARDVAAKNPTEDELRVWHKRSGLPLKKFFNTSGKKYSDYWGARHRLNVSLTASQSFGDLSISLRERWQYTYRPEKTVDRYWNYTDEDDDRYYGDPVVKKGITETHTYRGKGSNKWRNRLQLKYKLTKMWRPYVSAESTVGGSGMDKMRYSLGTEIRLTKQHWLDVKYLYQHTYKDDDSEGNRHVIGIGYAYKF